MDILPDPKKMNRYANIYYDVKEDLWGCGKPMWQYSYEKDTTVRKIKDGILVVDEFELKEL
jgi:hypothetical protein